ncbi:hypothetical protein ACFQV2_05995 [Actinokineospora soli]|uniref:Uncharacterized protein n=1 Tax=Actinokineospora soli TaxID=1048753 RepID=A0ABW2TJL4_9PSEU
MIFFFALLCLPFFVALVVGVLAMKFWPVVLVLLVVGVAWRVLRSKA